MNKAPVVNQRLADALKDQPNPMERFALNQGKAQLLWSRSAETLIKKGRPVVLDCGHLTITKALNRAACPRCGEMIRAGFDYDGFRHHGYFDDFNWPEDPLRQVHEQSG